MLKENESPYEAVQRASREKSERLDRWCAESFRLPYASMQISKRRFAVIKKDGTSCGGASFGFGPVPSYKLLDGFESVTHEDAWREVQQRNARWIKENLSQEELQKLDRLGSA